MKSVAATLDTDGAVMNFPATEPGNLREPRSGPTKFLYPSGSRPVDGYTIKRGIGRGGFGEVYYATSDGGKEVALKLIRRNLDVELRGVAHCMNVKHPNLLALFDIRRDADDDTWVVMEYVGGETLDQVIARNPNGMPLEEVLSWMHGIAGGVGYLHDHGIVHRDLKPGNIFSDEGIVKLGDYGLSKFISASRRSGQTESVGTVHYMAPEVANGRYGKEIDLYALGVILYEMLTGHVPFEGESVGEVLMKHLTAKPDLNKVDARFRPLLERILDKDPSQRPQSVQEILAALPQPASGTASYIQNGSNPVPPIRDTMLYVPAAAVSPALPPPLPVAAPEEPIWKAIKENWTELYSAWQKADLNIFLRVAIIALAGLLVLSTSWLWLTAIPIYLIHLIVWHLVNAGRQSTAAAGGAALGASPPQFSPSPPPQATPAAMRGEQSAAPYAAPLTGETTAYVLPVKSSREKATELVTSLLVSALVAAAACFVVDSFANLDLGQMMWLTLVSTVAAWEVIVAARFADGVRADNEMTRRFVLLIGGLVLGYYAWGLDRMLLVDLPYSMNSHLRDHAVQLPHAPSALALYRGDGSPTLTAYLAYFGFLLPVLRWWRLADPQRRRRFSLWATIVYGGWSWMLSWFWPFPDQFGVAVATIAAVAVQLSSPWTHWRARDSWRRF